MKVSTVVAVTLASVSNVVAVPLCAYTCWLSVMNHPDAKTCTEANMYLCFCKVQSLTLAYKTCACNTCGSATRVKEALDYGRQTCIDNGAPIGSWLTNTC